jgi:hypothetical protein
MTTFIRCAGAVGLLSFTMSSAWAASSIDSAFTLPAWSEPVSIRSVSAGSPIMHDSAVHLVSDEQPAADHAKNDCNCSPSCGCDSCNSCDMCCCCCSQWYVSAGAVILHRDRPSAGPILTPVSLGITVDASSYDFGWNGGPDVTVGRQLDCCNAVEVRYFNDIGAGASQVFAFIPEDFRIATGAPVGVVGLTTSDDTDLHSLEVNFRRTVNDYLTFLAGFRYLELDDDLNFVLNVGGPTALYQWGETNHLYGGQIGADLLLYGNQNSAHVDTVFKSGLYGVASKNNYLTDPVIGPTVTDGGRAGDVAFVGEIDLLATYPVCNHVALQGGYQLLWIDGVALATDQAVNATANVSGAGIDTNGSLFYHGATAALVVTW